MELTMIPFNQPIAIFNADGTPNIGGSLTHYVVVRIQIGDHAEHLPLFVTDLRKSDLFLGHEWLDHHNPVVDWKAKTIEFTRCPKECECVLDDNKQIFKLNILLYLKAHSMHIRQQSVAMDIAIEQSKKSIPKTFEQSVPEHYRTYKDVFEEAVFNKLPEHKPYDHAIELIDHKPYCGKLYNITLKEQEALDLFLEENLCSGQIRPSKSEWGAPFFFVKKKDGKLRPVQDYRKLNAQTKHDHHSLPRIEEQLNKLRNTNWYSKLDI